MIDTAIQDLRYAARILGRKPGFTLVVVLTLALGIGANTAIFSVVEAVLVRPPAFRDADRLVYVWEWNFKRDRKANVVGPANFIRWRERNTSFEKLAGLTDWTGSVTGAGEPERVSLGYVTADFFETLGARAELGRALMPRDGEAGHDDVVVLSHDYWMRRFGGDPRAVGKTVTLNGIASTIVGVMPRGFRSLMVAEMWTPVVLRESLREVRGRWMTVVGRLKPGVSRDQAQAEMASIAAGIEKELPDFSGGWGVEIVPLREQLVGGVRQALLLLFGAVCLVLLIAGANVANLLLARATDRHREMAVRLALGAPRWRLVRQMLTESTLLSLAGGAAGWLMALWAVEGFRRFLPPDLGRFTEIRMNGPVFLFALLLAMLTGILFGAAPALAATRVRLEPSLREGTPGTGTGKGRLGLRNALVVAEVALSLVLLVGAGLLLKSFSRLSHVDFGLQSGGVLALDLSLPSSKYGEPPRIVRFYDRAVEEIRALPGVASAGAMSWRPLTQGSATSFRVAGEPLAPPGQESVADVRIVTPGLFETLGVPLLRGRGFTREDDSGAPRRVVVNRTLAQQHWPGGDPIGRHIFMSWGDELEAEIIGVAGDVRLTALDVEPRETLYWPQAQLPNNSMTIMVRSAAEPMSLVKGIKARIAAIDPDLPVAAVKTLDEVKSDSLDSRRFLALLLEIFAAMALALAALGNYGVLAYSVARRSREIGIRMALGARTADVVALVIHQGMVPALLGLAIGVPCAVALSRLMTGLLFKVSSTDAGVFAAVPAVLASVCLMACVVPARRAARVDPAACLRSE